jgi:catecholate siderophore receptor
MRHQQPAGVRAQAKRALSAGAVAGLAGLALAPSAFAAETTAVAAANAAVATASDQIESVDVFGQRTRANSPKYTAPLTDTPQTITVISKGVIDAQNLLTLRDVLTTAPGITFGAGEGGGGYGDSINLRGYSANSDITVDGVRDSAQYSRTDPFNLEQIEVINGANSVYAGGGSVGGSINLVSKRPGNRDSTTVSAGVGSDKYGRLTVDANKTIGDTVSVRLNLMAHRNDAPGRDVENFKRWAIAPAITVGLGTPTQFTALYIHQSDDNIPQYGVPFYNGRGVPGIDSSNYYGYSNLDTQQIKVDTVTGIFDHAFSENLSIRNLSRFSKVTQYIVVDPPQGAFCLSNGLQPAGWSQTATTTNLTGYVACTTPGLYPPGGPRGNVRDSENTLLYNQTDLSAKFATGGIQHSVALGVSFLSETFELDGGNVLRNPGGALPNPVLAPMNVYNPNHVYAGPVNFVRTATQDGERRNQAVYLFDTAEITPQIQVNAGVRYEYNEGENRADAIAVGGVVTPGPTLGNDEHLFSYRFGLVYKPVENASLYVAYGNSQTPSQTAVNGGCAAATCNVDPEKARNIEVGAKWDVMGGKLSLTGALFRNERTNYKVPSGDPTLPDQVLAGRSRVDGVALGAAGSITEQWAVFANYTYLDSEVLQSVSDFTANGGVTGTERDWIKGDPLTSVPGHAFSLWTTYNFNDKLQLGYGATYQGSYYLTQHFGVATIPATTPVRYVGRSTIPLVETPDYWVHRLMVTYRINQQTDVRLNINNLLDKTYYERGRNNGWATPGAARSAVATLNYRF